MKLFGYELTMRRNSTAVTLVEREARPVPSFGLGGMFGLIREPFAGGWQKNVAVEDRRNLLAFAAVYACVSIIAQDIGKLRLRLMEQAGGIWEERDGASPFQPVLRKPNAYQTTQQFIESWLISKLLHGNTYVLKERDARRVVTRLHVLNPRRVTTLVTERWGDVYYELKLDDLAEVREDRMQVPASEIIHDRYLTLWHPLVGVSPIYACGSSATQGIRIQANSAQFFENASQPSLVVTAPKKIGDETAARIKQSIETNTIGVNLGRVLVLGDGLEAEAMTINATDAQLIEQLKWTVEDVARAYRVPLHKLAAGQNPTHNNIGALNQDYYSQTLQSLIEAIEALLDDGLALPSGYRTEFDVEGGLMRMDPLSRMDIASKGVSAAVFAPNEARARENLPPKEGGDMPLLQQQMWPINVLAKRPPPSEASPSPAAPAPAEPVPPPDVEAEVGRAVAPVVEKVADLEKALQATPDVVRAVVNELLAARLPALADDEPTKEERAAMVDELATLLEAA